MDSPRRRRFSTLVIAGLVVCAAWCAFRIVDRSGTPGFYYRYRHGGELVYPVRDVLSWIGAIGLELGVAAVLLRRTRSVPRTCLLLGLAFGIAFGVSLLFAMHAPPYYTGHVISLQLAAGWLLVSAIVTGLASHLAPRPPA